MRKLTILLAAAALAASSVGCCGRCRNLFYKGSPCGTAMASPTVITTPVAMAAPQPAPMMAAPMMAAPMMAAPQTVCVPNQPACIPCCPPCEPCMPCCPCDPCGGGTMGYSGGYMQGYMQGGEPCCDGSAVETMVPGTMAPGEIQVMPQAQVVPQPLSE
jgi:hypothetical protein